MTEKTKQEIIKAQESNFVKGLKKVAESKGYEIGYVYVEQCGYGDYLKFQIAPKDSNTYTPKIYDGSSSFMDSFDNKTKFEVQTTSYGALNEEEMQKFLTAICNGMAMQQYLNNLDWSECPRINRVEE